jgi:hypothetical protein
MAILKFFVSFPVPPSKFQENTSNYTTIIYFQILPYSLIANHPVITMEQLQYGAYAAWEQLNRIWKKVVVAFRGTGKAKKKPSIRIAGEPGRDTNQAPFGYKSRPLPLHLIGSRS